MDNLSEYLPLLIILLSVVFTIIGRKRKSANMQETGLPGQESEEIIEYNNIPKPFGGMYPQVFKEKPKKEIPKKPEIKPAKDVASFSSQPIMYEDEDEDSPYSFE